MKEFKPALRFLLIFIAIYLGGNVLYGVYVEYFKPYPDPATIWVTEQTAATLRFLGQHVNAEPDGVSAHVLLTNGDETVLRVFEGCNGLNVVIVFISFVVAFGGSMRQTMIFLGSGFLVLHACNLLRIILLYYTAIHRPLFFYYFHKYFFTAALYCVVFALWIVWTRMKIRDSVFIRS